MNAQTPDRMPACAAGRAALRRRLAPVIVGMIAFAVYLRTELPGMAFGDWGEMQTVPHVLGIAHPSGYPTYVLLAWLTQLAPVGSIAWRANTLSAVLMACALAVTVAIMLRLGVRPAIAVAGGIALGAVRTVWSVATVAEVNALHLLFVALLIHRALVWDSSRRIRDLLLGGLLLGLALGNHLLALAIAPIVAIFVVWVGWRDMAARPWLLGAAATAVVVGLSVYLYLPLAAAAAPPLAYNRPTAPDSIVWLVSGTQFRGQFDFLTADGPAELASSLPVLWSTAVGGATVVLPIAGVCGLLILIRRRPAVGLACMAILVVTSYVWATYLRLEHYLLAAWLIVAVGASVAAETVARRIDIGPHPMPAITRVVGSFALVLAMGLVAANWGVSDRSGDRTADTYVDALFGALPRDAAIVSAWDTSTPLWHAQLALDRRPDVLIVDDTDIVFGGWETRERRIASLICERPVFILRLKDRDLEATRAAYRLERFLSVRVAIGGPSAVATRTVYRVQSKPWDCA